MHYSLFLNINVWLYMCILLLYYYACRYYLMTNRSACGCAASMKCGKSVWLTGHTLSGRLANRPSTVLAPHVCMMVKLFSFPLPLRLDTRMYVCQLAGYRFLGTTYFLFCTRPIYERNGRAHLRGWVLATDNSIS